VLGTAIADTSANGSIITLTCGGKTYIVDTATVDCPGTDGQPGNGECTNGTCNP
jgi:hypothetical protein